MSKFLKYAAISSVALSILSIAPASFAAETLEIRNFVGSINWSNEKLSAKVEKNGGDTKITGRRSISVDGGQSDIDGSDCKASYGRYDFDWFGKKKKGTFGGYESIEDLPVLTISMTEKTKLILRDSVVFTTGAPNINEADLELRHCGNVTLGNIVGTLALDNRGSADVTVGNTGQIAASLKGSGDLTGANSTDVIMKSHGSGDVELANLDSLEMTLHGSGDLITGDIDGPVELLSHGSGDIELGDVSGRLSYSGHGSGDLEVSSVQGETLDVQSQGSGDIEIDDGAVGKISAIVRGSATIDFSGEAETAILKASGSGDIFVNRVTGVVEIKSSGSGDVEIDERS